MFINSKPLKTQMKIGLQIDVTVQYTPIDFLFVIVLKV